MLPVPCLSDQSSQFPVHGLSKVPVPFCGTASGNSKTGTSVPLSLTRLEEGTLTFLHHLLLLFFFSGTYVRQGGICVPPFFSINRPKTRVEYWLVGSMKRAVCSQSSGCLVYFVTLQFLHAGVFLFGPVDMCIGFGCLLSVN